MMDFIVKVFFETLDKHSNKADMLFQTVVELNPFYRWFNYDTRLEETMISEIKLEFKKRHQMSQFKNVSEMLYRFREYCAHH